MNAALKHMLRNKRQREGRRPSEPYYPPNLEGEELPPGFAYETKEAQQQRANFFEPPAYEINELGELPTAHQNMAESLDASNPPDSNNYANGNKIRPWAHVRVPTYLAIAEWEGGADDEFLKGKLAAEGHKVPQQVGGQTSIDITPLIPEGDYTTYGAINTLDPGEYLEQEDGYLYA
jgi:hypothetical protein